MFPIRHMLLGRNFQEVKTMNEATIAKKQEEVLAVVNKINGASSTIFVDYLGLTVAEVSELRVKLHAENCEMKVTKNNILRRAVQEIGCNDVEQHLVGPCAYVTAPDEVTAAKLVYEFAKDHDKLSVKAGIVNGAYMTEAQMAALAKLPNKLGMVSMLLSVLQAPIRGLAVALNAVSEQK
jgi:large subunit ribosomal protein L10